MPEVPGRTASMTERFDTVNPRTPHVQLLSGGEWMLAVTDTGAGVSCCRGLDMTWYSADLLRRPQGVFVLVEGGEGAFPVTRAPDYWSDAAHQAEFGARLCGLLCAEGRSGGRYAGGGASASALRAAAGSPVKNRTAARQKVRVTVYFEPCLARREDAGAHPGVLPVVSDHPLRSGGAGVVCCKAAAYRRSAGMSGGRLSGRYAICMGIFTGKAAASSAWRRFPVRNGRNAAGRTGYRCAGQRGGDADYAGAAAARPAGSATFALTAAPTETEAAAR